MDLFPIILESYTNTFHYFIDEVLYNTHNNMGNYFWYLVYVSLFVWGLEILFPWRKNQPKIRKDFWLDTFYMFFNFYFFNMLIFAALSSVSKNIFETYVGSHITIFPLLSPLPWPPLVVTFVYFIIVDFAQWFGHVILHRVPFLWQFHQVHHSVEQMGFAAHLRYHWFENIFYSPIKYLVLITLIGVEPETMFLFHFFAIAIGHINHANVNITYGPLKYIFNNPAMHIWHHSKSLPKEHPFGMNFGITLSVWDYIFKTAYLPFSGRDISLGFKKMESFPQSFLGQLLYPFIGPQKSK